MIYSDITRVFKADYEDGLLEGLMKMPGVTPSLAGHFFNAAEEYFTAEPWIWLSNYDVLKIEVGLKSKEPLCSGDGTSRTRLRLVGS